MVIPPPSHPDWLLPLASDLATLPLVGGKGANLARLARAGFPVPPGFLITTQAYQAFVAANSLEDSIRDALPAGRAQTPDQFEAASRHIRALFALGRVPVSLADQILAAYADLAMPQAPNHDPHATVHDPPAPVAVRSSATAEDLPEMSFAGQQDTYLNVVGADALLRAVVDCWSSLWTARALSYRARNQIPHTDVALAVVVQQMVESEASGVLFTANPLTGLRSEIVIDATVGLGEALVSGQVEPDHYVVDTRTGQITGRTLGAKAVSVRSRPGGGTMTVACRGGETPPLQALPDAQILALAALGQQVAEQWDAPQDIEWAAADGALYLLQTRPITSLFPIPAQMPADPLIVMLSFGAVQGMLDPITPLGRDVMVRVMAAGARLFGRALTGETQRVLFVAGERLWINLTPVLRNTVGRRIMPVVTSFVDPAAGELLDAIWHDPRLQPGRPGLSFHARRQMARFFLPVAGNVLLNLLSPQRRRRLIVDRGEHLLATFAGACAAIQGEPHARLAQLAGLMPAFIPQHVPRVFRLFVAGVASGMASFNLVKTLTRDLPDLPADRALAITRGLPNNPTTEMDLALWQVAQAIRRDPASQAAFQEESAAALAAAYRAGTLPAAAQQALTPFMARYGSRGLAEIDLGRPRWSEDPAHVMEVVAGYLQITDAADSKLARSETGQSTSGARSETGQSTSGARSETGQSMSGASGSMAPDAAFRRGAAVAAETADTLAAAVRQQRGGWLKARLLRFAVSRARALMALRESPKFFVVRLFGLFRAALLEAGQGLAAAGELDRPDDLFYLSCAELAVFAGGTPADWRGTIAARREAYRREELRRQVPRLLLSDGRAFHAGLGAAEGADGGLFGSPVSPGSVEGRVRVLLDPRQAGLLPGEIMVCRGTDPSWTPLFLTAAGLIMEVGGLMTHGAVVAREYGLPAVVGVDRATERLRTGQRIALNGSTGEIKELD